MLVPGPGIIGTGGGGPEYKRPLEKVTGGVRLVSLHLKGVLSWVHFHYLKNWLNSGRGSTFRVSARPQDVKASEYRK